MTKLNQESNVPFICFREALGGTHSWHPQGGVWSPKAGVHSTWRKGFTPEHAKNARKSYDTHKCAVSNEMIYKLCFLMDQQWSLIKQTGNH